MQTQSVITTDLSEEKIQLLKSLLQPEGFNDTHEFLEDLRQLHPEFKSEEWEYLKSYVAENKITRKSPKQRFKFPCHVKQHTEVSEANGEGMAYIPRAKLQSWDRSVKAYPALTFMPKSKEGLKNLVKWAKAHNKRIRATGYLHTSSELYTDDGEITVSMIDLFTAMTIPATYPPMDPNNDLQGIQLVGEPYIKDNKKKIQCKVGAATCNYHLQDWLHDSNGGNKQWALPFNVVMTEITLGGSNAPICHGAGIHNKTLSDLVTAIEFINVNGELQTITDKEQLKAAAGCFGLLGIVTSITLELDEMTYANLKTAEKEPLIQAIPPITTLAFTPETKKNFADHDIYLMQEVEKSESAFRRFIERAENDYYAEWFWFPFAEEVWVNSWKNNGKADESVRYPGEFSRFNQRVQSYMAHLANIAFGDDHEILRKMQAKIITKLAMLLLPNKENVVCTLEDAIHFRHGIQNVPTKMTEWEIPIPRRQGTQQPDWSIARKAWWAVLETFYNPEHLPYLPMRMTLEMRVMDGSDIIMAPQHNNHITCSIEIITPVSVDDTRWKAFMQDVLDKWAMLKDDTGNYLNIRPHWAKYFQGLTINRDQVWLNELDQEHRDDMQSFITENNMVSLPVEYYLKRIAYNKEIVEFKKRLESVCEAGGYTLKEAANRFSNNLLDYMFGFASIPNKNNINVLVNAFKEGLKKKSYLFQHPPFNEQLLAAREITKNILNLYDQLQKTKRFSYQSQATKKFIREIKNLVFYNEHSPSNLLLQLFNLVKGYIAKYHSKDMSIAIDCFAKDKSLPKREKQSCCCALFRPKEINILDELEENASRLSPSLS